MTVDGTTVTVDLDGDSRALRGQASFGLILGTQQLALVTRDQLPDARTLCVTYDGVPTSVESGGPSWLHDASGCPIDIAHEIANAPLAE